MRPYASSAKKPEALLSYISFGLQPIAKTDRMWELQDLWQEANIACWQLDQEHKALAPKTVKNRILDRVRAVVPGSRTKIFREWPEFAVAVSHEDERIARDFLSKLELQLTSLQQQLAVDYWLVGLTLEQLMLKHQLSTWVARQELRNIRNIAKLLDSHGNSKV